jgi:endogenous inhibitor of DNA gyrase (YacG/DUF329 family)
MKVKCPTCKKEVEFSPDNRYRPFCSERCSTLDLGAWADEKYRVPVEEKSVNENSLEESDAPQDFPSKNELN